MLLCHLSFVWNMTFVAKLLVLSISFSFVSSACFSVFLSMNYENSMKNSFEWSIFYDWEIWLLIKIVIPEMLVAFF